MMKSNEATSKPRPVDVDLRKTADNQQDTTDTETLCHACGFSSEFVPEGMIACHHCFSVLYCSVECRDWEWTTSHHKTCQPIIKEANTKTSDNATEPVSKNDGKLGESFSDGSTSIASIDANNLFDRKQSPFLSKMKVGRIASTNAVSPKQLRTKDHDRTANDGQSKSSKITSSNNNAGLTTKRGPTVSKSLGNYVVANSPSRNINNRIPFVMSTDDDDDSDSDDNNKSNSNSNTYSEDSKSGTSTSEYAEEESVGLSVLEAQSDANLTVIAEESLTTSGPISEASWRRNVPTRLASIRTADSTLVMNDSAIINGDSLADMTAYQKDISQLLEQEDDLAYGVRSNGNSESISSMMGNHNSTVIVSSVSTSGYLFNLSTDHEDLVYSDASGSNVVARQNKVSRESIVEPEVVESSNSSDSAEHPARVVNSLGSRPLVIQRAPSLRGFRDAYNECDTESLHSRSLARSLSSSDDSLSSHVDAGDLPERMQRSTSSLRDFRDIYNSDLNNRLLSSEQSVQSFGCSSSLDEFNLEIINNGVSNTRDEQSTKGNNAVDDKNVELASKVKEQSKLSAQLELISLSSRSNTTESVKTHQPASPTKSDDTTSSLLMARLRNESMKNSLNNALRVYEQVYGEDAAKDIFLQLTNSAESHGKSSADEEVIVWKRPETVMLEKMHNPSNEDEHQSDDKQMSDIKVNSNTEYAKYRTSLSSSNLLLTASSANFTTEKSVLMRDFAESSDNQDSKQKSLPPTGSKRYLQYRDNLLREKSLLSRSEKNESELTDRESPTDDTDSKNEFQSIVNDEDQSKTAIPCTADSSLGNVHQSSELSKFHVNTEGGESTDRHEQQQLKTRFSQYRKSMERLLTSSSLNDTTTSDDIETMTRREPQRNNIDNCSNFKINKTEPNVQNETLSLSNVTSNANLRYITYRQELCRSDSCESQQENREWRKVKKAERSSSSSGSLFMTMVESTTGMSNEQKAIAASTSRTYQEDSMTSIIDSGESCLSSNQIDTVQCIDTVLPTADQSAVKASSDKRYSQYRSSLQLVPDEEDKEHVALLKDSSTASLPKEIEEKARKVAVDGDSSQLFTHDGKLDSEKNVNIHGIETAVVNSDVVKVEPRLYQLVDMDEVSVTSRSIDCVNEAKSRSDQNQSLKLDALGNIYVSCASVNVDKFIQVWTEVEADRKSLFEERARHTTAKEPISNRIQWNQPKVSPKLQPSQPTNSSLYKDSTIPSSHHTDIETGLLLSRSILDSLDDEQKLRVQQYHRKQRMCWCMMIFAMISFPLVVGLGVALRPNSADIAIHDINKNPFVAVPIHVSLNPTIVPTPMVPTMSPIDVAPNSYPVSLIPVQFTRVPTISPSTMKPTSTPTINPVATISSTVPIRAPPNDTNVTLEPTNSPIARVSLSPTDFDPISEEGLLFFLQNASFDGGTSILNPGSPQQKAFAWLQSDANFLSEYSGARILQRYALATLYFSTDGTNWADQSGWLTATNECMWYTTTTADNCDSENMYSSLDLSSNDLTGVIPNEITLLPRITSIKLSGGPTRFIGGIIPSSLGSMSNLKVLDLQDNYFFGSIPSELSLLDKLEVLDLSMNRLSLMIPSEIGNLVALKRLNLAANQLTGELPSAFTLMTSLELLSLGKNNLSGPVNLGSNFNTLSELNLEANRFTSISVDVGLLPKLESLTMYENLMIGSIPTQIVQLSNLKRLDLHGNSLTGPVPADIGSLSLLTNLDMSKNKLSDKIPASIGLLTNLEKLHLQNNLLSGPLPVELGLLSSVSIIRINNNDISGSVPEKVCENFGLNPIFILDCLERSDGTVELICPPGTCCSICCNDESGCACKYEGTTLEFLCTIQ